MPVANTFKGDIPALTMDSNDRTDPSSKSIATAYAVLYFFHMVTYIVMHSNKVRSKEFIDLERKVYIPVLACGASYLIHSFSWWPGVLVWFMVILWCIACIVCMVPSLRKGMAFKIVITLALLMCLIYWGVYFILYLWLKDDATPSTTTPTTTTTTP